MLYLEKIVGSNVLAPYAQTLLEEGFTTIEGIEQTSKLCLDEFVKGLAELKDQEGKDTIPMAMRVIPKTQMAKKLGGK